MKATINPIIHTTFEVTSETRKRLKSSKTQWKKHALTVHSFSGFQEGSRSKWDAYRDAHLQPIALLLSQRPPSAKDTSRWEGCKLACSKLLWNQYHAGRTPCGPTLHKAMFHTAPPTSQNKCLIRELAQEFFVLFCFLSFFLSWVGWRGRKQLSYKPDC